MASRRMRLKGTISTAGSLKKLSSSGINLKSPQQPNTAATQFDLQSPQQPASPLAWSPSQQQQLPQQQQQQPLATESPHSIATEQINSIATTIDPREARSPMATAVQQPQRFNYEEDYTSSSQQQQQQQQQQSRRERKPSSTLLNKSLSGKSKYSQLREDYQQNNKKGTTREEKLTILHFTFYNPPKTDVMTTTSPAATTTTPVVGNEPPVPMETGIPVIEASKESIIGPRVKVGPNGELIVDQESLLLETSSSLRAVDKLSRMETVDGGSLEVGNSGIYRHKQLKQRGSSRRGRDWSETETLSFYTCLSQVGTDFSMMAEHFPGRTRHELKAKYKREDRRNPMQISRVLEAQSFDPVKISGLGEEDRTTTTTTKGGGGNNKKRKASNNNNQASSPAPSVFDPLQKRPYNNNPESSILLPRRRGPPPTINKSKSPCQQQQQQINKSNSPCQQPPPSKTLHLVNSIVESISSKMRETTKLIKEGEQKKRSKQIKNKSEQTTTTRATTTTSKQNKTPREPSLHLLHFDPSDPLGENIAREEEAPTTSTDQSKMKKTNLHSNAQQPQPQQQNVLVDEIEIVIECE